MRQLFRSLERKDLLAPDDAQGTVELISSGGDEAQKIMRRLLEMP